jgi:UDP-glucose 4-epimerase
MTLVGKDIIVTGGAGFIGSWIARTLCAENRVRILDDLSTGKKENISGAVGIRFVHGDVRDKDVVSKTLKGADVVFHEAANVRIQASIDDPQMDCGINIGGR